MLMVSLGVNSSGVGRPHPHGRCQSAGLHGPPEEVGRVQRCLTSPFSAVSPRLFAFASAACRPTQPLERARSAALSCFSLFKNKPSSNVTDHIALARDVIIQQLDSGSLLFLFLLFRKKKIMMMIPIKLICSTVCVCVHAMVYHKA